VARERSASNLAGEELVRSRNLQIPVDPFALADAVGITVLPKPTKGGVSGLFMRVGGEYVIAYAEHVINEGFRRFSVAHELGHYFLPGHPDFVLAAGDVHESRAGFTSKDPHEVEADQFAVGLLMPKGQFSEAMRDAGEGLAAIETLASTCRTSLTATAIRYTECCREPVAIVCCNQDRVEFAFMSEAFTGIRDITWLRKGEAIPRRTLTSRFVGDPGRITGADREDASTHVRDWFGGGPDMHLLEQVIGLGNYGRALTVLTPEEPADEEDLEEDDALIQSWQPTFSKSRRR
jgi:hypothetical protein